MSSKKLSTHGVQAIGAKVCEVRRDGRRIGYVRKIRKRWDWRPDGWTGWTGDYKRMRDAVAELDAVTGRDE